MQTVTKQSYEKRKALYEKYEKRIQASQIDKAEAKSQGDLSENFGYVEAKKEGENLRRIQAELKFKDPELQIIDPLTWADLDMDGIPRAMIGASLKIKRDDKEETILLGGAWDSDLESKKIVPYNSPLGKLLIPKKPGFTAIFEPTGETIEIISADAPIKEDLKAIYLEKNKEVPKNKIEKEMTI